MNPRASLISWGLDASVRPSIYWAAFLQPSWSARPGTSRESEDSAQQGSQFVTARATRMARDERPSSAFLPGQ